MIRSEISAIDPYARSRSEFRDPPTSFWRSLGYLGPGLIVASAIVGSGEMIITSALGAKVGFACLWLIVFSCLGKTIVMAELGRFTISSGETSMVAFDKLPGPRWRVGWFTYLWFVMNGASLLASAGIIGGVGQAANLVFPVDAFGGFTGDKLWVTIVFLTTLPILVSGRYRVIERTAAIMVLIFTLATIICAVALQWTEYALTWSDVVGGMRFQMPEGALLLALGAYGGTGASAADSMAYTYWCLEKGYARFAGEADGSEAWIQRARGWIRVMHLDVWNMMLLFTLATIAFYFLGASVLKPMIASGTIQLPPDADSIDGPQTLQHLSNMYTQTLGPWAKWLFVSGAFFVLYSTTISAWAAMGRIWTDIFGVLGWIDISNYTKRLRYIRVFSFFPPLLTTLVYLFVGKMVLLIVVASTIAAFYTPIVAVGTIYLRYKHTHPLLAPTWKADLVLWICVVLIVSFSFLSLYLAWFSGSAD